MHDLTQHATGTRARAWDCSRARSHHAQQHGAQQHAAHKRLAGFCKHADNDADACCNARRGLHSHACRDQQCAQDFCGGNLFFVKQQPMWQQLAAVMAATIVQHQDAGRAADGKKRSLTPRSEFILMRSCVALPRCAVALLMLLALLAVDFTAHVHVRSAPTG